MKKKTKSLLLEPSCPVCYPMAPSDSALYVYS